MDDSTLHWSLVAADSCPGDWVKTVQQALNTPLPKAPRYAAQLLWQRQLCTPEQLAGFLDPLAYEPTPTTDLGPDLTWAVERILKAHRIGEKVAIWGDFDADGVTATAVLWDGLGALFEKHEQLTYYIPNRMTESHGLSRKGLDELHHWGAALIVTCDTGSTDGPEIDYARALGMEVIVTDHHTLPDQRPDVVALINPRSLPPNHPLGTLSGVAVAYKLLEGLYAALETPPARSLESLLDLVAIGLIADLVELRGDCRYLAQMGLRRLQTHLKNGVSSRPGVAELLALCRRTGDRPTDISFGIGPRINAVSRIHGDAGFCVELLTSQEADHCKTLAHEAELANTRRKALQQDVYHQVMEQVSHIDLATTQCLVLASEQWPAGILGLVASQVSQQLGRPAVLLRVDPTPAEGELWLARGSARSVKGLDLYELFKAQADLLSGFGGHPLAAGLTLPVDNIPMLRSALNRAVREALGDRGGLQPTLTIDLTVTVTDLGQDLFREFKVLEPYGMGNPVPRLLIRNAWFERGFHRNLRDRTGRTVKFIKTEFQLWDDTTQTGFPGEWWGHYKDELPVGRCDVVVELDHNAYQGYHVKLVDVRPTAAATTPPSQTSDSILDWRQETLDTADRVLPVKQIPLSWDTWKQWQQRASQSESILAVAYPNDAGQLTPQDLWQQLVGLAKFLSRTQTTVSRSQLMERLPLTPLSLQAGLSALKASGFEWRAESDESEMLQFQQIQHPSGAYPEAVQHFLDVAQEEQFRRRYFSQVPVSTLQAGMRQES
jgi:single-stranded-DNA-specific exonuclease